ncbi:MAG: tetratricopeptide repeat protein [candidate division Zixibacteria bacterium]|nr:tetratricopeptide repeat protein [candidate division Zixibacteria bacterium]
MKFVTRSALFAALGLFLFSAASDAGKPRKLPAGAYIKSAKIEIVSGDLGRYPTAIAMLDSLFLHYGPHAEGLDLMRKVMVDYVERASNPEAKMPHVEKMMAYYDSLKLCCESKDVKSNYKKDCKEFLRVADSTNVDYWRRFYNDGIDQLNRIEETARNLKTETDSAALAYMRASLEASTDSCLINMRLAIAVDPADHRTYIALGTVYEQEEKYPEAIEWLSKALELTDDKATLVISIAYNYIKMGEYCQSIPYFKQYLEMTPTDIANMANLAACYNNCSFLDSAMMIYEQILTIEPENMDALISVGLFFNQQASNASVDASKAREAGDEAGEKELRARQMESFDSALVYFQRAAVVEPDNPDAVEQVAVVNAIRGNYEPAAKAFSKLVELKPGESEHWTSLGDCYLYLKNYPEATKAYEEVVKLEPDNVPIWENLVDLYREIKQPEKQKAAEKKLGELTGQ